jgi:hypothetical protein
MVSITNLIAVMCQILKEASHRPAECDPKLCSVWGEICLQELSTELIKIVYISHGEEYDLFLSSGPFYFRVPLRVINFMEQSL